MKLVYTDLKTGKILVSSVELTKIDVIVNTAELKIRLEKAGKVEGKDYTIQYQD